MPSTQNQTPAPATISELLAKPEGKEPGLIAKFIAFGLSALLIYATLWFTKAPIAVTLIADKPTDSTVWLTLMATAGLTVAVAGRFAAGSTHTRYPATLIEHFALGVLFTGLSFTYLRAVGVDSRKAFRSAFPLEPETLVPGVVLLIIILALGIIENHKAKGDAVAAAAREAVIKAYVEGIAAKAASDAVSEAEARITKEARGAVAEAEARVAKEQRDGAQEAEARIAKEQRYTRSVALAAVAAIAVLRRISK